MNRDELIDIISTKIKSLYTDKPIIVAIDGVDTSGKTTLAKLLKEKISNACILSIDMFHNKNFIRKRRGSFSAEGYYRDSFNYKYIVDSVLSQIHNDTRILSFKRFNYKIDDYVDEITVDLRKSPIILFEGVFMQREELCEYYSLSIFLHINFDEMLNRALKRDIKNFNTKEELIEKYTNRYIGGQKIYLFESEPKGKADILIDNNDFDNPIIERI